MNRNNNSLPTRIEINEERDKRREKAGENLEVIYKRLKAKYKVSEATIDEIKKIHEEVPLKRLAPKQQKNTLCALVYIGCRLGKESMTIKEALFSVGLIPELSNKEKQKEEIHKRIAFVCADLGIRLPAAEVKEYIKRFCTKIGCSEKVTERANEIAEEINNEKISLTPINIALAAINMADRNITVEQLHQISGKSHIAIRNAIKTVNREANASLFFYSKTLVLKYLSPLSG